MFDDVNGISARSVPDHRDRLTVDDVSPRNFESSRIDRDGDGCLAHTTVRPSGGAVAPLADLRRGREGGGRGGARLGLGRRPPRGRASRRRRRPARRGRTRGWDDPLRGALAWDGCASAAGDGCPPRLRARPRSSRPYATWTRRDPEPSGRARARTGAAPSTGRCRAAPDRRSERPEFRQVVGAVPPSTESVGVVAPHAVVEDSPGQDRVAAGGAVGRPVEENALACSISPSWGASGI